MQKIVKAIARREIANATTLLAAELTSQQARIAEMDFQKKPQFYPRVRRCQRIFSTAAALLVCTALPVGSANAQQYQLKLNQPESFRLASTAGQAPTTPDGGNSGRSARLAELPFAAQVENAAKRAALDPALVHALIYVESRHNPAARSPKGALGLMQVLPETASRYGIRDVIRSVEENLLAGTSYLRDLMSMFDGRIELVLAAYNAGENAVVRHGLRIPPYRETQLYVPAVLEKYREWQEPPPAETAAPRRIVYLPGTLLEPMDRPQGSR
jgi:soluble lytic murein transglycosylase-like protein